MERGCKISTYRAVKLFEEISQEETFAYLIKLYNNDKEETK